MDKKQAHYLATLAAKETFKRTFKKLAQEANQEETDKDETIRQIEGLFPVGDTDSSPQFPSAEELPTPPEGMFADDGDKEKKKKKKKDCGCDEDDENCDCDGKKKEASAKLMRIAAAYVKAAK